MSRSDNAFSVVPEGIASIPPTTKGAHLYDDRLRCRLLPANLHGPFDPPEWLWEGRVPSGELTLVAGRGDAGKTTLTLDVAAQLSRGDLAGTMFGRKGKTVFLSDEASFERVITPRYAAAGGEPGGLYGVEYVEMTKTGDTFTRPMTLRSSDIRLLAQQIREQRIDLLIIDPIDMLLGAVDSHRNNEVRAALRLIQSVGCTVIGVQHLTKSSSGAHAGDRVMGSAAYRNFARSVLMVERDKTDQDLIVLAHYKCNVGPRHRSLSFKIEASHIPGYGTVRWLDEVETSADDLLTRSRRGPSLLEQCKSWLGDRLESEGPMVGSEVLRLASNEGFGRTTVYEARKALGVISNRDRRWSL